MNPREMNWSEMEIYRDAMGDVEHSSEMLLIVLDRNRDSHRCLTDGDRALAISRRSGVRRDASRRWF